MAKKSTFGNMVLVLTLICLVSSAILGVVYGLTKRPIEAAETAKINASIQEVVPAFDNQPSKEIFKVQLNGEDSITVYPAKKDGQIIAYAIQSKTTKGYSGLITLMVGVTADGIIYNTAVVQHAETPGLGARITDRPGFADQFDKTNIAKSVYKVTKDGGQIDAISASTISSRAYCDAVNTAGKIFKKIKENQEK